MMRCDRSVTRLAYRTLTTFSLALMVASIWNASACAFICAHDEAVAHRPGQCHEGGRAERHGAGSAEQACPREVCARLQPAFQTSRPAEVAAPQLTALLAFFPEAPSGTHADLTSSGSHTFVLDRGLGPPLPPSQFTILRT